MSASARGGTWIATALVAAAIATGCCVTPSDRLLLERQKEEQRLREDLAAHPERYVAAGAPSVVDNGIVNDYCQLVGLSVTNASRFDVKDPRGTARYVATDGREMATVPWAVQGEVPAGGTRRFNLVANEISGKCARVELRVEGVR